MVAQVDLLRLSVLVRDTVINSRPEYPITTFETVQEGYDGSPTCRAAPPVFPVTKVVCQLKGTDDFAGIDVTIEASGNDAVAKLANVLSGM